MSHFFISYAHHDRERVQQLVDVLQKRKFPVWVDDRLTIGDRWLQEIPKAIRESAEIILMMSPASSVSEWVEAEVALARNIKRPVLPIKLSELTEEDFWYLVPFQHEDARGRKMPGDAFFAKLAQLLHQPTPQNESITEAEASTIAVNVQQNARVRIEKQESMSNYLNGRAKRGDLPVTYGELASEFDIHLGSDGERYQFANMLGRISREEHEQNRPLLSAVVVKAGAGYPGAGFYNFVRALKPQYSKMEDIMIYAMELKAVQQYWEGSGEEF
jgi:hypothetical protein